MRNPGEFFGAGYKQRQNVMKLFGVDVTLPDDSVERGILRRYYERSSSPQSNTFREVISLYVFEESGIAAEMIVDILGSNYNVQAVAPYRHGWRRLTLTPHGEP